MAEQIKKGVNAAKEYRSQLRNQRKGTGAEEGNVFDYQKYGAKESGKVVGNTIKGFKRHAVQQAITRGFKLSDILKIVREGKAIQATGRYGTQTRYTLGRNTVVVNAKGEVVTVFSDAPGTVKGLGKGFFIPFK